MRILFAGTPEAAIPSLTRLLDDGHDVAAVLTRAPARAGRRHRLNPSPVHSHAEGLGLPVLTPHTLKDRAIQTEIAGLQVDAVAVVAYGMLVPPELLDVARHGWVNLHFSLLPAWRGAAPVQHAIAAGDDVTGASTFRIEEGLDTGPVFGQLTETVRPNDTAGDLLERLSISGAELLSRTFALLEAGRAHAAAQEGDITHAPTITVADAEVDWSLPALAVDRRIRAYTPAPGAWTMLDGVRIKLGPAEPAPEVQGLEPGQILAGKQVYVGTGSHPVKLSWVMPAGKKRMEAAAWARGARLANNARFGGDA